MTYFVLDDGKVTPQELLRLKPDIVIVTYEFLETQRRDRVKLPEDIANYQEGEEIQIPKRSATCLHAAIWRMLRLPIKRLILDEGHRIKSLMGKRFATVSSLHYTAVIELNGTLYYTKATVLY